MPRANSPARRIEAISRLAAAGIPVTVSFAPVIPALNDHELENVLETAQAAGAKRMVAQSIAFAYAQGPPGTVHVESDPLLPAS